MSASVTKQLDRSLGLGAVYSIAVGAMMGSGVFVLPGLAAHYAGPWVSLSYLLAGILVMPALFSKAELVTAMPVAGGSFVFVERSLGPWVGTIAGLGTWFALSAKTAFALVGLGGYLVLFSDVDPKIVALVVLSLIVAVNILGAGKASKIQQGIVVVCLFGLSIYVVAGWPTSIVGSDLFIDSDWRQPSFPTGFGGIFAGAGFVFVSYNGVTKVCSVAEEVRNPSRNIPLGMMLAQFSVMGIYALVSLVITTNVHYDSMIDDRAPVATAALAFGGETGQTAIAVIAIAALISMCNAGVMASARFPFAMSRVNFLPASFKTINKRFGTPVFSLVVTGLLLFVLVTFLPVKSLAKLASGFTIFIFLVVNLAVIFLRETGARWYRPTFRSPLYPWMQVAGILGCGALLYTLGSLALSGIAVAVVGGSLWYFGYVRSRINRASVFHHLWGESHTLQATEALEAEEAAGDVTSRVLVPVFGGEPAPSRLVQLAASFVEHGKLEVLRLEEVADQTDLSSFLKADEATRILAERAAQIGIEAHVEVEFHDMVTHNAKDALRHHAHAMNAEWIVMEWPTRSELHYLIRHPMSWWLNHPPCDLAIFLDRGGPYDGDTTDDFTHILVLAEPGPYDSLIAHVADSLAACQAGATITFLWPVAENASGSEIQKHRDYHDQLASLCATPCESRVERGQNVLNTVTRVSEEYDLLILGAHDERTFHTLFFGSQEHRMAERAKCSVLKIKAPRHQVHHRFEMRREDTQEQMILTPYVKESLVSLRFTAQRKVDVFREAARMCVADGVIDDEEALVNVLMERERRQNTALRGGVAITAPAVNDVTHTKIVIVTLSRAIDYQSSDRPMVDVVLFVLAPHSERQTQLWVLERLARMSLRSSLLSKLRSLKDARETREAVCKILSHEEI